MVQSLPVLFNWFHFKALTAQASPEVAKSFCAFLFALFYDIIRPSYSLTHLYCFLFDAKSGPVTVSLKVLVFFTVVLCNLCV
jgi:hypothetical protein